MTVRAPVGLDGVYIALPLDFLEARDIVADDPHDFYFYPKYKNGHAVIWNRERFTVRGMWAYAEIPPEDARAFLIMPDMIVDLRIDP